MKVAYLIYNKANGLGGHYRSLRALLQNWKSFGEIELRVIHFGTSVSPVLVNFPKLKLIKSTFFVLPEVCKAILNVSKNKPDILHCYDNVSYFIGRIISLIFSIPIVYTKCGGSNKSYAPVCKHTVLFSEENLIFLQERNKKAHYYLVANRVETPEKDELLLRQIRNSVNLGEKQKTVVRIGNVVKGYRKSIESAFVFTQQLQLQGVSSILLVVGKELDDTVKDVSKDYPKVTYFLLDDIRFTKEANKILYLADYVIGTGRGAMEAIGLGKNVYVSSEGSLLPEKVTSENFLEFLRYNFSERSVVKKKGHIDDYYLMEEQTHLKALYTEYCAAIRGNEKILKLYKEVLIGRKVKRYFVKDFIINLFKYWKTNVAILLK